ncbi:hypothetical protein NITMOv2_1636 [Nitrospira moscoviensis]|uniref:Uncharacterized protein n=1 Tax=Nitrospira moscoviensis TaxID=42253 RepID=A0A0K2GAT8_NITMO|nr:hypothetical protein NITMOv2_1636 [Nitrospira moscoviensis]
MRFEKLAKAEAKSKSQLFCEMLCVHEQRRRQDQAACETGVLMEAGVEALVFQNRRWCRSSLTRISAC